MRYIRILSELLNQIRYSSAKQILVEVAFIKLAKPQMESDTASLADRIRQLEESPVMHVSSGAQEIKVIPVRTEPVIAEEPIEEVAPETEIIPEIHEEIYELLPDEPVQEETSDPTQNVIKRWGEIKDVIDNMMLKTQLKKAVPVAEDGRVTLYVESALGERTIKENLALIAEKAKDITGAETEFIVTLGHAPDQDEQEFDDDYLSSILENINIEVGLEDR
jgi:hypothetical protein